MHSAALLSHDVGVLLLTRSFVSCVRVVLPAHMAWLLPAADQLTTLAFHTFYTCLLHRHTVLAAREQRVHEAYHPGGHGS